MQIAMVVSWYLVWQMMMRYDDFVGCVLCAVKHDDEDIQKVKDYIKENPARKSDDILEYLDELGI